MQLAREFRVQHAVRDVHEGQGFIYTTYVHEVWVMRDSNDLVLWAVQYVTAVMHKARQAKAWGHEAICAVHAEVLAVCLKDDRHHTPIRYVHLTCKAITPVLLFSKSN